MQKNTLTHIVREEILRALIFGIAFFAFLSVGFVSVAYAASGGKFGEILNKILVKAWDDPTNDGTVKNSEKLGGNDANTYVRIPSGGYTCPVSNQCIYGLEPTGTPLCR